MRGTGRSATSLKPLPHSPILPRGHRPPCSPIPRCGPGVPQCRHRPVLVVDPSLRALATVLPMQQCRRRLVLVVDPSMRALATVLPVQQNRRRLILIVDPSMRALATVLPVQQNRRRLGRRLVDSGRNS